MNHLLFSLYQVFFFLFSVSVQQIINPLVNEEIGLEDWEAGRNRYSLATFLHIRAIVVFYTPRKIFSNFVTYYLGLPFPFDMNFISLSLLFWFIPAENWVLRCSIFMFLKQIVTLSCLHREPHMAVPKHHTGSKKKHQEVKLNQSLIILTERRKLDQSCCNFV